MVDFHAITPEQALSELKTSIKGLTGQEAASRLQQYGLNELKEAKKESPFMIFLQQFNNFLVWILLIAVVISAIIGDVTESIVIVIIVIVNAVIGFIQEYRAEKAIEALKKLSGLKADVLRDGERKQVESSQLVPGDIIFLETGDKIPADCRLIEQSNFETLESSLTGESTPVAKDVMPVKEDSPIADRKSMAFSGTIVTKGRAKAVAVMTGMQTEIGRIAKLIEEAGTELTPLQKRLEKFGKQIGILTLIVAAIVFAATVYRGGNILEMFETAVSLAVAAIPEGLPAVVAVSLALGVQRMIKRNALIRKLPSVETLGSTTVIATDKTGTLTLDKMTVRKIYFNSKPMDIEGEGYSTEAKLNVDEDGKLLLRIGALCNDSALTSTGITGDPTEAALLVTAAKAGMRKEDLDARFRRVDEIPFDSERKLMTTIHQVGKQKVMYTKGAPDIILKLCTHIQANGKVRKMAQADRKKIEGANEGFASQALRVLGFAYKPVKGKDKAEAKLIFVGLQAMIDPPRPEVKIAIERCKQAGIRVIMITGDHRLTAEAIAKELGIEGKSMAGVELDKVTDLEKIIGEYGVFARVSPEHKIRIIDALKKQQHIAAMTGDGVNDAPALKKADIGIAMGITGTDVAKEASTMILTDDNFASIVNAVEEGRGIYDNIKKFVYFLLSSNLAEVLVIFLAILAGLELPLVAIQILWMNLVTDGLPAVALGVEPVAKDIMRQKPRNPNEGILTRRMVARLLLMSGVITAGTLGVYLWSLLKQGWHYGEHLTDASPVYVYALTMAFTTLVMFELFNAIASKSETRNFFADLLNNRFLLLAILSSLLLQLAVIYTPLSKVFDTVALSLADWGIIIAVASAAIAVDTAYKVVGRKKAATAAA